MRFPQSQRLWHVWALMHVNKHARLCVEVWNCACVCVYVCVCAHVCPKNSLCVYFTVGVYARVVVCWRLCALVCVSFVWCCVLESSVRVLWLKGHYGFAYVCHGRLVHDWRALYGATFWNTRLDSLTRNTSVWNLRPCHILFPAS